MSESLTNKGISIIGEPTLSCSNVIVVVGTARGGTSMVAGSMAKLGVFMGDQAVPPVFEDVKLSNCFEKQDFYAAQNIAEEYSRQHGLWGWKRPSSIEYLDDVHRVLGAPRYIFIYKDIMSIAQRNAISMLADIMPGLERALRQYASTLEFLRKQPVHAMMVSYEKAMAEPTNFVKELVQFCGFSVSEEQLRQAAAFITPNPEHYLDASRITKAQGRLGGLANRRVYGWARLLHSKNPASVNLFMNDQKIGTVVANLPRPDLMERFNQACAYNFELPEGVVVKAGDVLRARVVNEVADLENSPFTVSSIG